MEYTVYVLRSTKTGAFYIGQTNNLERRLAQHNDSTRESWASRRGPWKVVHEVTFANRSDAVQRERQLKSLKSRKVLLELIEK